MSGSTPVTLLEVVRQLLSVAREVSGADGVTFVLRDGDQCAFADESAIAPLWKGRRVPMATCLAGWVMLNAQAVALEDIYADPRISADAYRPTFVQSLVVVPVRREAPVAAIGAYWASRHRADEREVARLQSIADAAALALESVSLRESLRQAERANRTKDEFLAALSHELRTPLTAIVGWAKMLRSGRVDADTTRRAVEVIERNADAQRRLVGDLLDVTHAITGKIVLELSNVDLVRVVQSVLESAAPAIEAKRHVLTVSFPTDAVVRGDAERLAQVASNLVSNAVKFTPAGGSVEVRLARTGHAVTLVVSDSGVGIAPDVLPHVFDRFREADGGVPRKYSGLGVGLAIVRHLVELHRGRVRAESAGEGRGSTFSVEVPIGTIVPREGATIS